MSPRVTSLAPKVWIVVSLVGLALGVGPGFAACDAGCHAVSLSGQLHEVFGLTGSLALVAAPWLTRSLFPNKLVIYGLAAAILFLFAMQLAAGLETTGVGAYRGLIQWLFFVTCYTWLALVIRHALRQPVNDGGS